MGVKANVYSLDYTKINTLSRKYGRSSRRGTNDPSKTGIIEKVSDFDMINLVEDVVEATLVAHRFKQSTTSSYNLLGVQDTPPTAPERNDPVHVLLALDWKPSWLVRSEAGAWRRILINLLGNALKYTVSGHVEVCLQYTQMGKSKTDKSGQNRILVSLSVRDTGQGISSSYLQQHIFQPFAQEDVLSSGTGLGLSIVKQLVDSLGGTIEVCSELDIGTEVTVSVPLICHSAQPSQHVGQLKRHLHSGLKVCLLGMDIYPAITDDISDAPSGILSVKARTMLALKNVLRSQFGQWFGASVTSSSTLEDACGDIVVIPEEQLSLLSSSDDGKWHERPKGSSLIILSDHVPVTSSEFGELVQFLGAP